MILNECIFSEDRKYRYVLEHRINNDSDYGVLFLGLNPSKADETILDNTVKRCIDFTKTWGYSICTICNIFAFRATDPKVMKQELEPIGKDNDYWIKQEAEKASLIIVAWGNHGKYLRRSESVLDTLQDYELYCFGLTKDVEPKHPLYLKKNLIPFIYRCIT